MDNGAYLYTATSVGPAHRCHLEGGMSGDLLIGSGAWPVLHADKFTHGSRPLLFEGLNPGPSYVPAYTHHPQANAEASHLIGHGACRRIN
jgi:hypothetical protein